MIDECISGAQWLSTQYLIKTQGIKARRGEKAWPHLHQHSEGYRQIRLSSEGGSGNVHAQWSGNTIKLLDLMPQFWLFKKTMHSSGSPKYAEYPQIKQLTLSHWCGGESNTLWCSNILLKFYHLRCSQRGMDIASADMLLPEQVLHEYLSTTHSSDQPPSGTMLVNIHKPFALP